MNLQEAALRYLKAGLCTLPAIKAEKRPAVARWKHFQNALPSIKLFTDPQRPYDAICIVCGAISGNLEILDFDVCGEAFEAWKQKVNDENLLKRLVIERSPSGGYHVIYRAHELVSSNLKLAQRIQYVDSHEDVVVCGKTYKPRLDEYNKPFVVLTTIETRGEGGLFLCYPTPGYELIQGDLENLPVLTPDERDKLLFAAWELNQLQAEPHGDWKKIEGGGGLPGSDYNERGDFRDVLKKHGWRLAREEGSDGNEHWTRPGKVAGTSATIKDNVFYCFSSNAFPFEPNRAYTPFAVYALLEHNGDFKAAASALSSQGYGLPTVYSTEDFDFEENSIPENPGPIPENLLSIPGFVNEVIDYTLATAPYPNRVLAFAGALTLQAFLAGRKVKDENQTRTNLYVLALANSGAGKNAPRKTNISICVAVGLQDCLGDAIASGEGIEDRMYTTPSMLFQTDEIDTLINSINRSDDARFESIMRVLLSMYSASDSQYPMRTKARQKQNSAPPAPGFIDQPCLCMFGTAIPKYYYEALSERMLKNGFLARLIIFDAESRGEGQDPKDLPLPESILATANFWTTFSPGTGNLDTFHPEPVTVPMTDEVRDYFQHIRKKIDEQYRRTEQDDDQAGMAIWARAYEKIRKLALIYAVSENQESPTISLQGAEWAAALVEHITKRMLYKASMSVSSTYFNRKCNKFLETIRKWHERKGDWITQCELARRIMLPPREFNEIKDALIAQQRIMCEVVVHPKSKKQYIRYRLV